MSSKFTGEVAFPPLEGKAVLRITGSNMLALEEQFGKEYKAATADMPAFTRLAFHAWFLENIAATNPKFILRGLMVGLKKPGGKEPYPLEIDDMPFPLRDAAVPLMDALNLAANGETFTEAMERVSKQEAERQAAAAAAGLDPEDIEGIGEQISPPGQPEI